MSDWLTAIHTLAVVQNRALGDSAIIAWAADELLVADDADLGGAGESTIDDRVIQSLRDPLRQMAVRLGRNWSLPLALTDPRVEIAPYVRAASDETRYLSTEEHRELKDSDDWVRHGDAVDMSRGLKGAKAVEIGLAQGSISSLEELKSRYSLDDLRPIRPNWALEVVDMVPAADRRMDGFSKGMRQRSKVAAALVKNPLVLVLDEPLNGADPVQRVKLISLFRRLGDEGRTVIVSSHVLHEVESMAERVIVVVRGRLAAAGGHHAIRDAMDDVPRQVLVRCADPRLLASSLVGLDAVGAVSVDGGELVISTKRARDLAVALPRTARDLGVRITEVRPLDDSLESLFRELVR